MSPQFGVIKSSTIILSTSAGYIVNLCTFYFYKIIGKLTVFFQLQEFSLCNLPVVSSTTIAVYAVFSSQKLQYIFKNLVKKKCSNHGRSFIFVVIYRFDYLVRV
jgi:hypothetical protein